MIGKWVSEDSNFWTSWVTQSMEFVVSLCTLCVGVGCFLSTLCSFFLSLSLSFFLIIVPKYKLIIWSTTCNHTTAYSLLVINSFPTHHKQNLTIFFVPSFWKASKLLVFNATFSDFIKSCCISEVFCIIFYSVVMLKMDVFITWFYLDRFFKGWCNDIN